MIYLFKNQFNLLKQLVLLDFKLRYNQSFLGVLWSAIKPLSLIVILILVFSNFKDQISDFNLFIVIGVFFWSFFQTGLQRTTVSLRESHMYVKKIHVNKKLIILSILIGELLNLFFLFLILFFYAKVVVASNVYFNYVLVLQIFNLFILTLGLSFMLSILYAYFQDVKYFLDLALQVGFFLTPIFYELNIFSGVIKDVLLLNPVGRIITVSRDSLLYGEGSVFLFELITLFICLLFLFMGYFLFNYMEKKVVEVL